MIDPFIPNQPIETFFLISWKVCLEFWLSLQHASAAELLFAVLVEEAEITAGSGYQDVIFPLA